MINHCLLYNKKQYLFCSFLCFLCFSTPASAGLASLTQKYHELKHSLSRTVFPLPVHIESKSEKEQQAGDIYGIIYYPFNTVNSALTSPANWCDIVSQHLNIKACTYQPENNHCRLTLYSGRKYYEEPENTFKLQYRYSVSRQQGNYFHSLLDASKGPLGTSEYRIFLEAIPIDGHTTFIHFGYSYKQGFWARFAMQTYLSTLGRNKIGFTVTGTNDNNQPVYIDGIRGVIERNVVRYYFAIQSYLDNLEIEADKQFTARISNWFDLTEKFHDQLNEMSKQDYLEYKQAERINQLRLQKLINSNPASCSQ